MFSYLGHSVLLSNGGLYEILSQLYPSYKWDKDRLSSSTKSFGKAQWALFNIIESIFNHPSDIQLNYNLPLASPSSPSGFSSPSTTIELDIFIPSLSLAFEYQGQHHYHYRTLFGDPQEQRQRDIEKKAFCQQLGITLIEVPYWWNHSTDDLKATIFKDRPELIPEEEARRGNPFSEEPPTKVAKHKKSTKIIHMIQQLQQHKRRGIN